MTDADIVDNILGSRNEDLNLKLQTSMNDSMIQLDNQLNKLESNLHSDKKLIEESKEKEKNSNVEKFSSIPSMMKCYICEDYCEDAVQIICCYENFCDKHIKEEIMKNFTCPNCKAAATMRDVVPNKKLRENIKWFKTFLNDPFQKMGMQVQGSTGTGGIIGNKPPVNVNNPPMIQLVTNPQIVQTTAKIESHSDKLDKIEENNERDMTPEEKMQFYQKFNENESVRKPSEDKMELDNKSHKSTSQEQNKSQKDATVFPHMMEKPFPGMHLPHGPTPFPYPGMMGVPPINPMQMKPDAMMYYQRMNQMYYHMPMGYPYPNPMGMFPIGVPHAAEDKLKRTSDKSEKSGKSASRSKSSSPSEKSRGEKHGKKRKRSRSRSRSRSKHRRKEKSKHDRTRDKERDRDRDKDKNKDRDKDRDKDKSNRNKKYK